MQLLQYKQRIYIASCTGAGKMALREIIDDMGMDRSSGSYFMAVL